MMPAAFALYNKYAPVGQTPVLRVPLTRNHVSAIGGITPEGRIFMQMQEYAYRAEHVVEFLRMLLHKTSRLTHGRDAHNFYLLICFRQRA
jgi:hypothetical protein